METAWGGESVRYAGRDPRATTKEEIAAALVRMTPEHPRLFGGKDAFQHIRDTVAKTPEGGYYIKRLLAEADGLPATKPVRHEKIGRRLLDKSRTALLRATSLGMAYRLTGEAKYADRLRAELLAVAAFPDWNPSHFLDTAEMTLALSVGYDWIYETLAEADRTAIRQAIGAKGLDAADDGAWWVKSENNWNQVCHAGLVAGALATAGDQPERAVHAIHRAVANLRHCMTPAYFPDGVYPEGPMYWHYGTTFNVILLAMLDAALGTDFGLAGAPGFDKTCDYMDAITAPSGEAYNYADSGRMPGFPVDSPTYWWFAKKYNRPDWVRRPAAAAAESLKKWGEANPAGRYGREAALGLLWHVPPAPTAPAGALWRKLSGDVPLLVYRGAEGGADAGFYFAAKGGKADISHAHMDAGSFILENDGVRWAVDLGMHDYHKLESQGLELFQRRQDGARWLVLRYNNLSHNTLTIDNQLHDITGQAEIVSFTDDPRQPAAAIDLTPVFGGQAKSARREFVLNPGERSVTVIDRLEGLTPGAKARWAMATEAEPDGLGGAELLLRQDGKELRLAIAGAPEGGETAAAVWTTFDIANPPDPREDRNPGKTMVGFETTAPAGGAITLRVALAPADSNH